ncbi:MAG: hypothetical protein DU429_07200 [Candidatus Tokpelaia sp.]|nr:MAG: hypothetical protein DU430_04530 [Candidatus Tokpelaia sp.]KAA6206002.1 MAG: hypothetical protein DU429_07200 [Candidatus Tokpelaia sp.]KAA6406090.1 hypothetical protein DPQ22_01240 [Candidatus Tokpelaia sp.]
MTGEDRSLLFDSHKKYKNISHLAKICINLSGIFALCCFVENRGSAIFHHYPQSHRIKNRNPLKIYLKEKGKTAILPNL